MNYSLRGTSMPSAAVTVTTNNFIRHLGIAALAAFLSCFAVLLSPMLAHAESLDVWWPSEGARLSGVQPFKAMIPDMGLSAYTMYWQVDGGQQNLMSNSYVDYPHKEASADVSTWNWRGAGPYAITFTAYKGSTVIGSATRQLYLSNIASAPALAASVPAQPAAPETITVTALPAAVPAAPASGQIELWWPISGATLSGTQPFKALVPNKEVSAYSMYWQVDGGTMIPMPTSFADYPHKEATVDVSAWNWRGTGAYTVTITAKDKSGAVIASRSFPIYVAGTQATAAKSVALTASQPASTQSSGSSAFYVPDASPAAATAAAWRSSDPYGANLMDVLAKTPTAVWLGGWNSDVKGTVASVMQAASAKGQTPVFVAYNIPNRDCGSYSAGGVGNASAYRSWISSIASGIGSGSAYVVLEPDALASTNCLSSSALDERIGMLRDAVTILKAGARTSVYLDAGHAGWIDSSLMADRLARAGIGSANGFSLNVSNFMTTGSSVEYGTQVSKKLGGAHFVVDTSRNGNGPSGDYQWCNPSGRAIGDAPTTATGNPLVDAYLWIKTPGESDGSCNGGPSAGTWWPSSARSLVQNAVSSGSVTVR